MRKSIPKCHERPLDHCCGLIHSLPLQDFSFKKKKRVCFEKWEHHLGGVGGDVGFVLIFFYFHWGDLCVSPDWKAQDHVGQSGNISFWDMGDDGPDRWVRSSNVSVKSRFLSLETFSVLLIPSSISIFQVGWLFHHFHCSFLQYWHFQECPLSKLTTSWATD